MILLIELFVCFAFLSLSHADVTTKRQQENTIRNLMTRDNILKSRDHYTGCNFGTPDADGNFHVLSTVHSIPAGAFDGCTELKSVTFEETPVVSEIGDRAFAGTDLNHILLPSSVYTIGEEVFDGSTVQHIEFSDPIHAEFSFHERSLAGISGVKLEFPTSVDGAHESATGVEFQGGTNIDIIVHEVVCPPKPVGAIVSGPADGCGWVLPDGPFGAMRDHNTNYHEEAIKFDVCPQYVGYSFHFPITMVGIRRERADVSSVTKHHNVIITFYNPGGPASFAEAEREYAAISMHLKVKSKRKIGHDVVPVFQKFYKLMDSDSDFSTSDGYFFDVVMPAGLIKMDRVKKFKAVLKFHLKQGESYTGTDSPEISDGSMVASCGMAVRNSGSRGINSFASFPYTTGMMQNTNSAQQNYETQCVRLREGDYVTFSQCEHYTGDPYLRLFRRPDELHDTYSQVYFNDDSAQSSCHYAPVLNYNVPSDGTYCLHMGCYGSNSCSATTQFFKNGELQN